MGKRVPVIHPFLFAVFPILFLFSHNKNELSLFDQIFIRLGLPIIITVAGAYIGWKILQCNYKDKHKAGILTSVLLLIFFSYAHLKNIFEFLLINVINSEQNFFEVWHVRFGSNAFYFALCVPICFLLMYVLRKSHQNLSSITFFLNIVSGALVFFSVINISFYEIRRFAIGTQKRGEKPENHSVILPETVSPDIYYIILDEYASTSTLQKHFDYDNHSFLDYLTGKKFYVASKSRSNYPFTYLSLASSLNMEYVNYLSENVGRNSNDLKTLVDMIEDNAVTRFLKARNYTFIHLGSGMSPTEYNRYADWDITKCSRGLLGDIFLQHLMRMTVLASLFDLYTSSSYREMILCQFDTLGQLSAIDTPIFVFAHILCPHEPFMFGPNGEHVSKNTPPKDLYLGQLIFVNNKLKTLIDQILIPSEAPPIIILQSDHGTKDETLYKNSKEQKQGMMRILNAYYLPDDGDKLLYETITPVNSFRIIFNHYFGASYSLLPDRSYYSTYDLPYQFTDVTHEVVYE